MKKNVFSRRQLAVPYAIFLFLFVIIPLFVLIYFGFTDENGRISFANFLHFFGSGKTIGTLLYSIVIALCTTIFCLILAYPVAFFWQKEILEENKCGLCYLYFQCGLILLCELQH